MGMRRMISPSMALLLVLVLVLSGCFGGGSKKPEEKYQLTISVDGQGSVDPKPGKYEYAKKTSVSLKATAAEGWEFSHWIGNVAEPNSAKTAAYVDKNMSITAVFAAKLETPVAAEKEKVIKFNNDLVLDLSNVEIPPETKVTVKDVQDEVREALPEILKPAGAAVSVSFNKPDLNFAEGVILRLPIEEAAAGDNIGVFYQGETSWEYQPTVIENGYAVAAVTHFSTYAVLSAPVVVAPRAANDSLELEPGQEIELVTDTPGAMILYSTTGLEYPGDFQIYNAPLVMPNHDFEFYAFAAAPNMISSEIVTFKFSKTGNDEPAVVFADPNLEQAVRDLIDKPVGELTRSDVADLTWLYAYERNIHSLDGIEHLENLENLQLSTNQVEDLSPLAGLTKLKQLGVENNQIRDITPLAGLVNLTELGLRANDLTDISPLTSLTKLEYLTLGENQIADLAPLAELKELTSLNLTSNQIADISPLAGLTNLTQLYLSNNQLSEIKAVEGLTNLQSLTVENNLITDIAPLVNNSGLGAGDAVYMRWNYLDLTPGSDDMNNIQALMDRGLYLFYDPQNRIVTFADPNLEQVIRETINKPEGDLTAGEVSVIWRLDADNRGISSLEGIEHLEKLQYLILWDNQISDLTPIADLTTLLVLNVDRNQVSDLSPVAGLTALKTLYAEDNYLTDISPVRDLVDLTTLGVAGNDISDISPITALTKLVRLTLADNEITDITPLVENAGLGSGDTITLERNYLDLTPGSGVLEDIQTLIARGADVSYTPQNTLETVVFADPNLEQAVRIAAGKFKGYLTPDDVSQITNLSAYEQEIVVLDGIERLENLEFLDLGRNQITELAPLSGLVNLKYLDIGGNNISDVSSLASLTKLEGLFLNSNQISDISVLAELTELNMLYLNHNYIADLSPLAGLTKLETLFLSRNNIEDIWPLKGLPELQVLFLDQNQIVDISALVSNSGLGTGDIIDLQMNYLDLASGSANRQDIETLLERGVDVRYAQQKYVITFADPSLERAVRDLIGKPSGPLVYSDVESIINLDASGLSIQEIYGIEHLQKLEDLDLSSNLISDISYLIDLQKLRNLNLGNNQITNISALAALPKLTNINLEGNLIADISPLVMNTELGVGVQIDLRHNNLGLTPGSENMKDLQTLLDRGAAVLYEPQHSSVVFDDPWLEQVVRDAAGKPDGELVSTDVWGINDLNGDEMGISSLSGIEHLQNLRFLSLYDNQIADLAPLSKLKSLQWLLLTRNQIRDLSSLAELTNLQILLLGANQISSIADLAGLRSLEALAVSDNYIHDISPLAGMTNLRHLDIASNPIADISVLAGLTKLEVLVLDRILTSDLSVLADLTQLKSLYAAQSYITDLSQLARLTDLEILLLYGNRIEDISPLAELVNLERLALSDNHITDIEALSELKELVWLMLDFNQISDISVLLQLTSLEQVNIRGNNLDLTPGSAALQIIGELEGRGVQVLY